MAEAEALVDGYLPPLVERIDGIRNTIVDNAEGRGWTLDPAQLDDRHIVRRMVLKRRVYGGTRTRWRWNWPRFRFWLHIFTVGAPLSFLDHHLRCGDSLFGAWVEPVTRRTDEKSSLFLRGPLERATRAAAPMQIIEGLTDAEIADAHRKPADRWPEHTCQDAGSLPCRSIGRGAEPVGSGTGWPSPPDPSMVPATRQQGSLPTHVHRSGVR